VYFRKYIKVIFLFLSDPTNYLKFMLKNINLN